MISGVNNNYFFVANFKAHISGGVIGAVIAVVGALIYLSLEVQYLFAMFSTIVIGSFLPDIDSDNGFPFQIIFGLLSVGLAGGSFYVLHIFGVTDYILYGAVPIVVFVFVRFVLGGIFKKFTHHRGIWHSIPAAIFVGLITMHFLNVLNFLKKPEMSFYIGVAMTIGYIIHLILDEIYATVNISGGSLLPKKSLGSALKWHSASKVATISVYGGILFLLFIF